MTTGATSVRVDRRLEKPHKFRVRAKERGGERGDWSTSDRARVQLHGARREAAFGQAVAVTDVHGELIPQIANV